MNIYDFKVKQRDGKDLALKTLKGKALLIVNTATGCGFTPQYEGLEKLYETYHDKGLEILDFPCDQFGHQAPGSNDEIHNFCVLKYNTKFDQLAKIEVNGENADPLYTYLKQAQPKDTTTGVKEKLAMGAVTKLTHAAKETGDIQWNFTKFLVDKDGNVVKRYAPTTDPAKIAEDIKQYLV